jgi:hypothetical protein
MNRRSFFGRSTGLVVGAAVASQIKELPKAPPIEKCALCREEGHKAHYGRGRWKNQSDFLGGAPDFVFSWCDNRGVDWNMVELL